jgi:hypothetical protein
MFTCLPGGENIHYLHPYLEINATLLHSELSSITSFRELTGVSMSRLIDARLVRSKRSPHCCDCCGSREHLLEDYVYPRCLEQGHVPEVCPVPILPTSWTSQNTLQVHLLLGNDLRASAAHPSCHYPDVSRSLSVDIGIGCQIRKHKINTVFDMCAESCFITEGLATILVMNPEDFSWRDNLMPTLSPSVPSRMTHNTSIMASRTIDKNITYTVIDTGVEPGLELKSK